MSAIKNIIFDLGGVIIHLAYERTREAFMALGVKDFDAIYNKSRQSGFFDAFDKGRISPEDFRNEIRKYIPDTRSDKEIDAAWDAMLLDIPEIKLVLLKQLKSKYRTFLLSNTNEIHISNFSDALHRRYGTSDFTPYFEECYYSCRLGMRKPDAEIFEFVLEKNGLIAEETLFVDDSVQHIAGAAQLGINTILFEQNTSLAEALLHSDYRIS
jgi:putative hydrolase of the HAD superfamily